MSKNKIEINYNPAIVNAHANTEKCYLVEFQCYESASKDLYFDIRGTGIVKGDWCYLKNSANTKTHKKRVNGKLFKIVRIIEEYPENFDIQSWENDGESDIEKTFISTANVKLDLLDEVDKNEIYPRLAAGEIILADIAYVKSGLNSRKFKCESEVILQDKKCLLGDGYYKLLDKPNLKITKIYDGFPKNFNYQKYFG